MKYYYPMDTLEHGGMVMKHYYPMDTLEHRGMVVKHYYPMDTLEHRGMVVKHYYPVKNQFFFCKQKKRERICIFKIYHTEGNL